MDKGEFYRTYDGPPLRWSSWMPCTLTRKLRPTFSGRAACARRSSAGTITASDFLALFEQLMNSATRLTCAEVYGPYEIRLTVNEGTESCLMRPKNLIRPRRRVSL
jgi:hypothetical protein